MDGNDSNSGVSILETIDEFMAAVPWGDHRSVLLFRRRHGGRTFVRLRTWNRHVNWGVWYPSQRFFVVPIANAASLADAIHRAAIGEAEVKPDWLVGHELEFGPAP